MSEYQPMPPNQATVKLLNQFKRTPSPNTLEQLVETGLTLDEAVCQITEFVATGFCVGLPTHGHETEYLGMWHYLLRADCSEKFAELKDKKPTATREELNQDRELQLLNGIRRGVHRAMVRNQNLYAGSIYGLSH